MNHEPFVTTELKPITQQFEKLQDNIDLEKLNADLIDYRDQIARLQYEVDAIPTIKAERDQFEIAMRGWMAANAPGGWIDDLRKERDAAREAVISNCARVMTVTAERDALKDAARLALDALNTCETEGEQVRYSTYDIESVGSAIAALKAVL